MDKLKAMQIFIRVVDTNSFSKAAETLDLQRTSVTNIIQGLEAELGVRLLQRTTRQLKLTDDGSEYYERSKRVLAEVDEMESSLVSSRQAPRGKLRIDVPAYLALRLIIPALSDFRHRYPDIELTIGISDRPADLVQEGIDCVIRGGPLDDSTLAARRIGAFRLLTCATPDYLRQFGEPQTIAELADHRAVNHYLAHSGRIRPFEYLMDGQPVAIKVASAVNLGDVEALLQCGLQGLGLFQSADFMVEPYLAAGQLQEVLGGWRAAPLSLSALYPQNRNLPRKVRVFIDWMEESLKRMQHWRHGPGHGAHVDQ
jgi:LysR family transcriptional regulator for bpeEF and oprC